MPTAASRSRKPARDRPKIFANDHGPILVRFERSQPQQIVERVGEVGALAGFGTARHDPKTHKPHGVVDAHAAGVPHARAQCSDEWRKSAWSGVRVAKTS